MHVGHLEEAAVLDVVAGRESPAVIGEVLVEARRAAAGTSRTSSSDVTPAGSTPASRSAAATLAELPSRLPGGGRRRDEGAERVVAAQSPVLERDHQQAERPHVRHVQPEVQRGHPAEVVEQLGDVLRQGLVVERGEIDLGQLAVARQERRLPLALPALELLAPPLDLEGLLRPLLRLRNAGCSRLASQSTGARRRLAVAVAADERHEPPVELPVHPPHLHVRERRAEVREALLHPRREGLLVHGALDRSRRRAAMRPVELPRPRPRLLPRSAWRAASSMTPPSAGTGRQSARRGATLPAVIHRSPVADVTVPEVALTPFTLHLAIERPDDVAFIDGPSGREVTYGQLDDSIRRLAGGLLEAGLAKGEVLAIMAPNCPEYATVFHGVAFAGGVVTTINPTYTDREVHHQLVDAGATRLVTVPMFVETATAAMAGTGVKELFVIGAADGQASLDALFGPRLDQQVEVDLDDVVVLPYSSGTTGLSKGVMLTHRNLVSNIVQTLAVVSMTDDDAFVAVLPFFHIYGMQVLMNTGLRAGARIVTMPRFDLEQFLQLHEEHGLTRAFVAPPMVVALAKHPVVANYDLSTLQQVFSGAAPLSAELAIECGERHRLRGRAGLRHDRAVARQPRHTAGRVQARIRRHHRARTPSCASSTRGPATPSGSTPTARSGSGARRS